jgi:ABC-type Na+ efflux pump permease subunit
MSAIEVLTTLAFNATALIPDPDPIAPPGVGGGVAAILGIAKWAALIVAVLALIGLGAVLGINSRRGEGGEHVQTFVKILIGILIVSGAVSIVTFIADASA